MPSGEHERDSDLQFAAEQVGGAGGLEPQGPPGLAMPMDLGELHQAPGLFTRLQGACLDLLHGTGTTVLLCCHAVCRATGPRDVSLRFPS